MTFGDWLRIECGYTDARRLPDGRWVCLWRLLFTTAILVIPDGDTLGYSDRWCYHGHDKALAALLAWDGVGEPGGWHRHPGTDRRLFGGKITTEKERREMMSQGIME